MDWYLADEPITWQNENSMNEDQKSQRILAKGEL